MKTIGIVRKVDELGRIVIPKETREQFGISRKDALEIYIDEEESSLILKKYTPGCFFCGDMGELAQFEDRSICKNCLTNVKKLA